jgi:hypothetical protein
VQADGGFKIPLPGGMFSAVLFIHHFAGLWLFNLLILWQQASLARQMADGHSPESGR